VIYSSFFWEKSGKWVLSRMALNRKVAHGLCDTKTSKQLVLGMVTGGHVDMRCEIGTQKYCQLAVSDRASHTRIVGINAITDEGPLALGTSVTTTTTPQRCSKTWHIAQRLSSRPSVCISKTLSSTKTLSQCHPSHTSSSSPSALTHSHLPPLLSKNPHTRHSSLSQPPIPLLPQLNNSRPIQQAPPIHLTAIDRHHERSQTVRQYLRPCRQRVHKCQPSDCMLPLPLLAYWLSLQRQRQTRLLAQ
jgi:hypothetical protein